MKKIYRGMISIRFFALTLLCMPFAGILHAQQAPYYTNFMFNKLPYNPGYAGSKDGICATLLLHQQWQGYVAEGAPSTQFLNVHAPVGQKHGLGIGFVNDVSGYEKTLTTHIFYNYKFNIGSSGKLGVGPSVGFVQKSLDGSKLTPEQANDPNVPVVNVSSLQPDFSFGLYYNNPQWNNVFAGLTANNLNEATMSYATRGGSIDYKLARHYYAMAGFTYEINTALALTPSLLYKTDFNKGQVDLNADLLYNNKIRGGLTYRSADAVSVLLGYKISDNFHIGYSYDITTTRLNTVSNGTHEIVVNYCFRIKPKVKTEKRGIRLTPRYM
jgi:type IX secretion system PorP/SprF family membrane protein